MRPVLASCVLALFVAGCASKGDDSASPDPGAAAMCLAQIDYKGQSFIGSGVGIEPVAGRSLGEGTIPPCGDVAGEEPTPAQSVTVHAVEDVPSDVAVVPPGQSAMVYIRRDLEEADMPDALRRLLKPPTCDPTDEPIELAGPWRGVSESKPPYDVQLYVASTSGDRYRRAYLSVRVPASLEPGLSPDDFAALQSDAGATADITAHCNGDAFVADRIAAIPR